MVVRIPMEQREIMEARRAQIPDNIVGKMAQGYEISEKEKEIVRSKGKVYVEAYRKDGTWVKPQLRSLSGFKEALKLYPHILANLSSYSEPLTKEEIEKFKGMSFERLKKEFEDYTDIYGGLLGLVNEEKMSKESKEEYEKNMKKLDRNIDIIKEELDKKLLKYFETGEE